MRRIFLVFLAIAGPLIMAPDTALALPNTKVASIPVDTGPYGIAGNGVYAVVAAGQSGYVDIIDLSNDQASPKRIYIGTNPSMVTISPDESTAYITNYGDNNVYIMNLTNGSFTTSTVAVGSRPIGIAVANNRVFVTNYQDDTFSYFPVGSSSVTTVRTWGGGPISIAADSNANNVYVANSGANAVNVFRYNYQVSNNYGVVTTVTTGSYPSAVLLSQDGTKLYVANAGDNSISVIDTSSNDVVDTISLSSLGGHPNALALTSDGYLMVINSPIGGITIVQTSNDQVISTFNVGSSLEQVFLSGPDAYVTDFSANRVYDLSSIVSISSTAPGAINDTNNNTSFITWSSTESGTYEVEIGGNGTKGSGTVIAGRGGSVSAGQPITTPIYASDFAGDPDGPYTIYIYVTTPALTAYASTIITLLTTPPPPATGLSATPGDGKAILEWTASASSYIGGYNVYFSTSTFGLTNTPSGFQQVAGNVSSYTVKGLTNGALYYMAVQAYDIATNESALSNITSVTPVYIPSPADLADQKGNCFIATAAYGSYDDFDVWVLRQFRDRILLKNRAGRWFVSTYYRMSPPMAHFIAAHDEVKAVVRVMLKPLVYGSMVAVYGTSAQKLILLFLSVGLIILVTMFMIRRNRYA
ncbi:MAG: beta-propeller fold lactonase family protein [Deltaproteobacteria bacterium]|nr:beta-propeller fold lactonase family protein [Deltaproteobacteria bacterium]